LVVTWAGADEEMLAVTVGTVTATVAVVDASQLQVDADGETDTVVLPIVGAASTGVVTFVVVLR